MTTERIQEIMKSFDAFQIPVSLKINGNSSYKSYLSAAISIMIGLLFIANLVINCLPIFRYENISTTRKQQTITKQWKVNSTFKGFAIGVDQLKFQQFFRMFTAQIIYYKERKIKERYFLQNCQKEKWPAISEQIFYRYEINQKLCPENNKTFYLEQSYRYNTSSYLILNLRPCNGKQKLCDNKMLKEYLKGRSKFFLGIQVSLYIYNIKIQGNQIQPVKEKINVDVNAFFGDNNSGQKVIVQFSTFLMTTDFTIFIETKENATSGNYIDKFYNQPISYNISDPQSQLVIVIFTMNNNFYNYTRKVDKLQDAIAKTGGFFYIIFPIVGFIIASYNTYNCDLLVAKNMFNQNQHEARNKKDNLLGFIKYTIYKYAVDLIGYKINWEDCKEIYSKKKETDCLMEINRIFKRLQNIQNSLKYCIDRNEAACLLLTQLPSLKQCKLQRLQKSYYQLILSENAGTTILDIRQILNIPMTSLQVLKEILAEKNQQKMDFNKKTIDKKATLNQIPDNQRNINIMESKVKIVEQQPIQPLLVRSKYQQHIQFKRDKIDLENLVEVLSFFPEIQKSALKIQLSKKYQKVQRSFSKSFFNLASQVRVQMVERIPIIILIRLMNCLYQIRRKRFQYKNFKQEQEIGSSEEQSNYSSSGQEIFQQYEIDEEQSQQLDKRQQISKNQRQIKQKN